MQAVMVETTHPNSPYDVLRPMRCRSEKDGRLCTGRGGDINWNRPDTRQFRCPKCGAFNVVHIVEAGAVDGR